METDLQIAWGIVGTIGMCLFGYVIYREWKK
jgi:hypothetical protein